MRIIRQVVVFDASDLVAESTFWAGMLGGRVLADDTWHTVFDADDRWVIGVQFAPDHVPPEWPHGNAQQIHLDLHVEDFAAAHEQAMALGARLLLAADDLTAEEGNQVYADPAGHPFCLGWGQPDEATVRRILGRTPKE
ncbi:MAG: VOC family protein [Actinobacteria bacterium]|nr:VOC family protein [Actinomycetota bacterium]